MGAQICGRCGWRNSEFAEDCRIGLVSELFLAVCTRESRVARYFSALRYANLWPFSEAFWSSSFADITSRISRAVEDGRHDCTAKLDCPLKRTLRDLSDVFVKIHAHVAGFGLRCLKKERVSTIEEGYECVVCGIEKLDHR